MVLFSSIFLWKQPGATVIVAGGNPQSPPLNDSPDIVQVFCERIASCTLNIKILIWKFTCFLQCFACPFLFHKVYYYCVSLTILYLQDNLCKKKIKVSQQTKPNQKYRFHTPILLIQEFATTCYIKMLHFLLLVIPNMPVFYTIQMNLKQKFLFS